ncbi:MAG: hypothetical protein ABIH18_09965 [Candidatus Omnitrophota bacterium]
MSVLICGFILFIIAFMLHILIWRVKRPNNTAKALIILFNSILISGIIILLWLAYNYPDLSILPRDFISYAYIILLFFSLFAVYILSYPAIEADSPSLVITTRIAQAGKAGLSYEEIKELLRDDLLVEPRLKDLINARLIDLNNSIYKINAKGVFFIQPFIIYRNFLGLGKGG